MKFPQNIRLATIEDAAGILDIYRPFVENTAVSFEAAPPTIEEMAKRISKYLEKHCWLVFEKDGKIGGYAYSSPHRGRTAYQWSIETSAYLAPAFRGTGAAKQLYDVLLEISTKQGYCTAFAGIVMPNPASERFHEKCGFKRNAVYENVGYKFNEWHTTIWLALTLQTPVPPREIVSVQEILF